MTIEFIGSFKHYDVTVNGWRVPLISATVDEDTDKLMLSLDDRIGLHLTQREAQKFVPFLADCIAFALGFGSHPKSEDNPPLRRTPAPTESPVRMTNIVAIEGK
jgi:hypothetical protein